MNEQQEVTRETLKINSLLETIARLENDKADLRVDLHVTTLQNHELRAKIKEWEDSVQASQDSAKPTD